MKLQTLTDITSQRLKRLPAPITRDVHAALMHAHDRIFNRSHSSSPPPRPVIPPVRPMFVIPPQTPLEPVYEVPVPPSPIHIPSPPLTPSIPSQEPVFITPTISPIPQSPPTPSPPSEPEADPISSEDHMDANTYQTSRNSISRGSRFSQKTTEITTEVIIPIEDNTKKRVSGSKRRIKKKQKSDADLELIRKMNEEWERKQQLLAEKLRESQEKEEEERMRLAEVEAGKKAKRLEERRKRLEEQREAARLERLRREELLRQTQGSPEPLHRRMESQFKAISEQEEFEYQKKLKAIKNFMQPIQLSSLLKHRNWYEAQKADLAAKKANLRLERLQELAKANLSMSFYKARALEILAEQEKVELMDLEEKRKYPSSVRLKQKEYSKIVREKYHHSPIFPHKIPKMTPEKRRKRAISAFFRPSEIIEKPKKVLSTRFIPSISLQSPEIKPKPVFRKRQKPTQNSVSDSNLPSKPSQRYKNYLSEIQPLSLKARNSLLRNNYKKSRLDAKSNSVEELKTDAEMMGKAAIWKEKQIRRLGKDLEAQIEVSESVSSLYIESIKAKLKVLAAVSTSF